MFSRVEAVWSGPVGIEKKVSRRCNRVKRDSITLENVFEHDVAWLRCFNMSNKVCRNGSPAIFEFSENGHFGGSEPFSKDSMACK